MSENIRKIGVLRGMETTFPDTLVPYINEHYSHKGVRAEFKNGMLYVKLHKSPAISPQAVEAEVE